MFLWVFGLVYSVNFNLKLVNKRYIFGGDVLKYFKKNVKKKV